MSESQFGLEPLASSHNRAAFSCGVDALDIYLQRQASQDMRRRVAAVFVCVEFSTGDIAGYYTLAASSISPTNLPEKMRKRLPRYPKLPVVLLGRLATDIRFRGSGIGEMLLLDALFRTLDHTSDIAALAVIVDAKDDRARSFYEHYGFERFTDDAFRLFMPMQTIVRLEQDQ